MLGFVSVDLSTLSGLRDGRPELTVEAARAEAWQTALMLPLFAIGMMLLTTGEELGWRGFLLSVLRPLGFWRAGLVIGLIWAVWHLPLTLTYAHLGEISVRDVVVTSVNLILSGYVLCGLRLLTDSVWPAVFGQPR